MMNAARLHVALQGIGLLSAAWQKADAYAHERKQMRAPGAKETSPSGDGPPRAASAPSGGSAARAAASVGASFIIEHPAMQRTLNTQRAWLDASRVLAYQTALELDIAKHHPDPARRQQAERWCALTTPVLKSACTHQAFHSGSDCLQVFGGHGYVREWGIEQHVRDARVAMIYEGTNEIQAIDLLVRKVLADGGAGLCALLDHACADLGSGALAAPVSACFDRLQALTRALAGACAHDATLAYWVADDYLRAVAIALLGWAGVRLEAAADAAPEPQRWRAATQALGRWVLPEFDMRCAIIDQRLPVAAP